MLITTTDILQNREIDEYPGLVAARVANSRHITTPKKQLVVQISETIEALENELTVIAEEMHADAIIGLKITPESMTTCAVGTAVTLK